MAGQHGFFLHGRFCLGQVKQLGAASLEYIVWVLIARTIGLNGFEAYIFGVAPLVMSEVLGHYFKGKVDRHLRANSKLSFPIYILSALFISVLGGGLIVIDQKARRLEAARIIALQEESIQARHESYTNLLRTINGEDPVQPLEAKNTKSKAIGQSIAQLNYWFDLLMVGVMMLIGIVLMLTASFMSAKAMIESKAFTLKNKLQSLQRDRSEKVKNVLRLIEVQHRVRYIYALIAAKNFLHDDIVKSVYKTHLQ